MATNSKLDDPHDWAANLFTRTGLSLTIRPVEPNDRALIEDFFRHVSADDLRFRFLTALRRVDDARIDELCLVDIPRAITFLAFHGNLLIAIATIVGDETTRQAEVALTTRPDWKHRGVSWTLLEHAIRFARLHGFRELVSIEKADNAGALGVERDMGFHLRLACDEGGELIASKALAES